jgi:hypothetical protein
MSIIIGVTGLIGSGKDTSADHIIKLYKFQKYAFANPIKNVAKILGFKHEEVYGTQEEKMKVNKNWGVSGREFMQKFGTDIMRDTLPRIIPDMNLGEYGNIWLKLFQMHICELQTKCEVSKVIISDVRFPDEADAIHSQNGFVIHIVRDTDTEHKIAMHKSETSMSGITPDYVIENHGTVEELYTKIDIVVKDIGTILKKSNKLL